MKRKIKTFGLLALSAFMVVSILPCTSSAQSGTSGGYGAAQVSTFQRRSSATQFSVDTIQNRLKNQAVSNVGVQGVNSRNFLSNSSSPLTQRSKPFSGVNRGPSVNPYLALSAPRASASDYYSIIRPQQQQQRENQRQQIATMQQQRRLNQLAARAPYSTTGDENTAPTGHVAVFQSLGSYQNTGNYFPPPSRPKQR